MGVPGLSLSQCKSHLQKYRQNIYAAKKASQEARDSKRARSDAGQAPYDALQRNPVPNSSHYTADYQGAMAMNMSWNKASHHIPHYPSTSQSGLVSGAPTALAIAVNGSADARHLARVLDAVLPKAEGTPEAGTGGKHNGMTTGLTLLNSLEMAHVINQGHPAAAIPRFDAQLSPNATKSGIGIWSSPSDLNAGVTIVPKKMGVDAHGLPPQQFPSDKGGTQAPLALPLREHAPPNAAHNLLGEMVVKVLQQQLTAATSCQKQLEQWVIKYQGVSCDI